MYLAFRGLSCPLSMTEQTNNPDRASWLRKTTLKKITLPRLLTIDCSFFTSGYESHTHVRKIKLNPRVSINTGREKDSGYSTQTCEIVLYFSKSKAVLTAGCGGL
jgi:hypothetical protein